MSSILPAPIAPDIYEGHAFLSIVVGQMEKMRPRFVPRIFGVSYNQVVYRLVVRIGDERGVHFLRSDSDSRIMVWFGNRMSFFKFHHAEINSGEDGTDFRFDLVSKGPIPAGIQARFDISSADREPPRDSVFNEHDEAKHWLVELFTAFDVNQDADRLDVVRIDRGEWDISFVAGDVGEYEFMTAGRPFTDQTAVIDSVIYAGDIPYLWHRLERRSLA
jgi:uncharacterized protein YqjF (DUF2071 family)